MDQRIIKILFFSICVLTICPKGWGQEVTILKWERLSNNCNVNSPANNTTVYKSAKCPLNNFRVIVRCVDGQFYAQCAATHYREDCSVRSLKQFNDLTGKQCSCEDREPNPAEVVCR